VTTTDGAGYERRHRLTGDAASVSVMTQARWGAWPGDVAAAQSFTRPSRGHDADSETEAPSQCGKTNTAASPVPGRFLGRRAARERVGPLSSIDVADALLDERNSAAATYQQIPAGGSERA
jgi:hypothetical protein